LNREISAVMDRTRDQSVPVTIGEASPAAYTHGKVPQKLSKGHVGWLCLWPCLVPSWRGASRIIWNYCWPWGVSSPPVVAVPALPRA